MNILKTSDLCEALNLKIEDIKEINQIADNRIKIFWKDGLSEIFKTHKPVKLINNRPLNKRSVLI